jgi:Flp pilus assembly protein TadG
MSKPMHKHTITCPRSMRGVALVEFTVSMPLLLLLLFGGVEFTHFLMSYSILNDAVRDSARYVAAKALAGQSGVVVLDSTLTAAGQNLVVYGNVGGTGARLLPALTTGQVTVSADVANSNVNVSVAYPYQALFAGTLPTFGFGTALSTALTLNISTTMKAL